MVMSNTTIPALLTLAECPLLVKYAQDPKTAEDLVQKYNQCVERLQQLQRGEYASLFQCEDFVRNVVRPLQDIWQRLTRQKYVVGCIGITQAGKSTVVNNVLGDEICKPGAMDACSSLPSRIVKADKWALDLEYLTLQLFEERLKRLCQEGLGLSIAGDVVETVRKDVIPQLNNPDYFRHDGVERPRLLDDLKISQELNRGQRGAGQTSPDQSAAAGKQSAI